MDGEENWRYLELHSARGKIGTNFAKRRRESTKSKGVSVDGAKLSLTLPRTESDRTSKHVDYLGIPP